MNVPIKPNVGVGRRISADVTCITVRQIKGKEVGRPPRHFNGYCSNKPTRQFTLHITSLSVLLDGVKRGGKTIE